jgi:endo-1,4-beta-xylanase
MPRVTRRKFLKDSAFAGIGTVIGAGTVLSAPSILTRARTSPSTAQGELVFRPTFVQRGRGPNLLEWAYASDERWDAFHSNITAKQEGVTISDTEGASRFGINVRWNVEGFGYLFITADNAGEFYALPAAGKVKELNLNIELASSRVARNARRLNAHRKTGWAPSREVLGLVALSEGYLEDARKAGTDRETSGAHAQKSLFHALWAGEALELEYADYLVQQNGQRPEFYFGCDARGIFEMHEDLFLERFTELFNYATITHVWKNGGNMEDFEPEEGKLQFAMRDLMFKQLRAKSITVEGRPLFWFHKWVTPEWIKRKSYDQLLSYVERTTRAVVGHYGDEMYAWEIVNELHDWANECQLTPGQTVELARLACDVAKATAPGVQRLVNNCCPYAEYVQLGEWSGGPAKYHQRTPWQFTKDLVDAGVDFTILAQQMYFPYRDLQDIIIFLERFEEFGKPFHLSEVGAPGGPTERSVKLGTIGFPKEPYIWHRQWDEELQADWLSGVYRLVYGRKFITGAHWFDFVDPYHFIDSGGLLRSSHGEKKAAFDRFAQLRQSWERLPIRK